MPNLEREKDRLYGLPPADFTAERDELAKRLRKDGDREAADEVKKLKKPSETAWAVNQLARNNRRELNALMKAGERLRKAQGGGGKRDALRAAVAEERERVGKLAALAEELLDKATDGKLDRIRNTLHAAAGDDETRELIDAGRLVEDAEPVGFGLLGPVEDTGEGRRGRAKAPEKKKAGKKAAPRDDGAARKARRELETARKREKDAREKADRARTELKRARAAAEDAAKALQNAERRAKEAEARESDAQDKLARTESAVT